MTYVHPVEYLIDGMIPVLMNLMLLKNNLHLMTLSCWTVIRIVEGIEDHSGYDLPFSIMKAVPFVSGALDHQYHHSFNSGNYASLLQIWDFIFGTSIVVKGAVQGGKVMDKYHDFDQSKNKVD